MSRKLFDEQQVVNCYEAFQNWNNPFKESEKLVSIISGIQTTDNIMKDLLTAKVGLLCVETFMDERIETQEKDLSGTIAKNNLLFISFKKPVSKEKG